MQNRDSLMVSKNMKLDSQCKDQKGKVALIFKPLVGAYYVIVKTS